jgi:putative endonuclease
MQKEGWHNYHVYILTNKSKSVLYTGVTNYLARRLFEHKEGIRENKKSFTARYNCKHLLYYERFTWVQEAIAREKQIKGWTRLKKFELIKTINPEMNFLEDLFPYQDSSQAQNDK